MSNIELKQEINRLNEEIKNQKIQTRLDKLKEIENVKRFNNSIVQCDCGIFHKQSSTAHHSISNLHNIGMTAINSYISRNKLPEAI